MKEIESKELFGPLDHFLGTIKALRVHLEDRGRIDRERAVYVDRNFRNCPLLRERVERVDHFLGATKRKSRNENSATLSRGFADYLSELCLGSFYRLMFTGSVGRLHDQRVSTLRRNWIPDYGQATSADVSRKDQPFCLSFLRTIDQH